MEKMYKSVVRLALQKKKCDEKEYFSGGFDIMKQFQKKQLQKQKTKKPSV